jgi:hypothetical protein
MLVIGQRSGRTAKVAQCAGCVPLLCSRKPLELTLRPHLWRSCSFHATSIDRMSFAV